MSRDKLDLMVCDFRERKHNMEWLRKMGVSRWSQRRGEYDRNTLYEILKELIMHFNKEIANYEIHYKNKEQGLI